MLCSAHWCADCCVAYWCAEQSMRRRTGPLGSEGAVQDPALLTGVQSRACGGELGRWAAKAPCSRAGPCVAYWCAEQSMRRRTRAPGLRGAGASEPTAQADEPGPTSRSRRPGRRNLIHVALQLYDTRTRQLREFTPLAPG